MRWISGPGPKNETFILLVEDDSNLVPEMQVAGYVVLRQVYTRLPASYHIYKVDAADGIVTSLGCDPVLHEAKLRLARVTERA